MHVTSVLVSYTLYLSFESMKRSFIVNIYVNVVEKQGSRVFTWRTLM